MKKINITFPKKDIAKERTAVYNLPDSVDESRVYIHFVGSEPSVYVRKYDKQDIKRDYVLLTSGRMIDQEVEYKDYAVTSFFVPALRENAVRTTVEDAKKYVRYCDEHHLPLIMSLSDMMFIGASARTSLAATHMLEDLKEALATCDEWYADQKLNFTKRFFDDPRSFADVNLKG